MKKILKIDQWDSSPFTEENVADKSHWFIKLSDAALTLLDIGIYYINYVDAYTVELVTTNYGNLTLYHPLADNLASTQYIAYVDSENKELCMCASYDQVASPSYRLNANQNIGNFARGFFQVMPIASGSSNNTYSIYSIGGLLLVKFMNNEIAGLSNGDGLQGVGYSKLSVQVPGITCNTIGCPLPYRWRCLASPIEATEIKYSKKPIVRNWNGVNTYTTSTNTGHRYNTIPYFDNEYFTSIYDCDKYYIGALKSSDNKKFIYNGLLFDVDDATDITVI